VPAGPTLARRFHHTATTMSFRPILTFSVCALGFLVPVNAQLPPKPPVAPAPQQAPPAKPLKDEDAAKLLEQLTQMAKTLDEQKFGYNAKVIRELRDAGASADKSFALWLDCMKDVEYDQKGRTSTDFAEWKRRQTKDSNRDRDAALQLQVQWLAIVLMHSNARTDAARGEAIAAGVAFLETVVDRIQKSDGRLDDIAQGNVLNSVFAKHYKLDTTLPRKEGGAYAPGDLEGIYDGMILPYYREAKLATSLMQAWTKRIEQETAIAAAFKFIEAREKFTAERLPELRWGQALDLFQLGQEETAAQQMLSLIKANMSHRNASRWMEELTALLKDEELPEPSGASPGPMPRESPGNAPANGGRAPRPFGPGGRGNGPGRS
jgi:hypothetical protein